MDDEYKDVGLNDINQDKMTSLLQNKSNTSLRDRAAIATFGGSINITNKHPVRQTHKQGKENKGLSNHWQWRIAGRIGSIIFYDIVYYSEVIW